MAVEVEGRWGKPEEGYLEVRLRTNWSHCVNLNAGPAVISPNIYKACIAHTFTKQCQKFSINLKIFEIRKKKKVADPRSRGERQWNLNFNLVLVTLELEFLLLIFPLKWPLPHAIMLYVNQCEGATRSSNGSATTAEWVSEWRSHHITSLYNYNAKHAMLCDVIKLKWI